LNVGCNEGLGSAATGIAPERLERRDGLRLQMLKSPRPIALAIAEVEMLKTRDTEGIGDFAIAQAKRSFDERQALLELPDRPSIDLRLDMATIGANLEIEETFVSTQRL
jgi:hypothetical protein